MMMMTTAYTLRNGPTKRGSLQLLLYDLHMRYAEKVVTQLLQEEEEDYSEEEEQQEAEEFAEAVLLMLEQQEGIFVMRMGRGRGE
jgi:hypothetical protein